MLNILSIGDCDPVVQPYVDAFGHINKWVIMSLGSSLMWMPDQTQVGGVSPPLTHIDIDGNIDFNVTHYWRYS